MAVPLPIREDSIFKAVELEKYLFASTQHISRRFAEEMRVSSEISPVVNGMIFTLTQAIWGHKVGDRVAEYPADWWQAVKERFFPRWAQRRWPVKYKQVEFETRDLFPEVKGEPGSHRVLLYKKDRFFV